MLQHGITTGQEQTLLEFQMIDSAWCACAKPGRKGKIGLTRRLSFKAELKISGERAWDGHTSFPAEGEDQYNFSFICFFLLLKFDFYVGKLKMMWNVQKSGSEKMSRCVCVRVCIKTWENSSFCISGILRPIELKFGVHSKQMWPFLWYHFRLNWYLLNVFEFLILIFWKMSVTALAAANFKRSS